uniref:1-alkyl-2-acetylglycerophosphocholine esterase n=2 Tax=Palpitomonas bilix TaxID=652834 RepID=A0A7S3DEA2_9EUKA|mmetsp:Transcript_33618/g.86112  ORF Transcript_33618/g.86112 Transcript_33618/m.86112 type:complete len:217 (+) Transcript_33618:291-941(+)
MDVWGFPLKEDLTQAGARVPTLFLNSDMFHWPENVERMHAYIKATRSNCVAAWKDDCHAVPVQSLSSSVTVVDSRHQNHSDLPVLRPKLMRLIKLGGKMDPHKFVSINDEVMLSFFAFHLPHPSLSRAIRPFSARCPRKDALKLEREKGRGGDVNKGFRVLPYFPSLVSDRDHILKLEAEKADAKQYVHLLIPELRWRHDVDVQYDIDGMQGPVRA